MKTEDCLIGTRVSHKDNYSALHAMSGEVLAKHPSDPLKVVVLWNATTVQDVLIVNLIPEEEAIQMLRKQEEERSLLDAEFNKVKDSLKHDIVEASEALKRVKEILSTHNRSLFALDQGATQEMFQNTLKKTGWLPSVYC